MSESIKRHRLQPPRMSKRLLQHQRWELYGLILHMVKSFKVLHGGASALVAEALINREMMTLIESWEKKSEDENPEESNENYENDDNDESMDDAVEVSKPSDSGDKVLEKIKDNDLNQQHKRRKE
ncbi:uncharacterized protein HKW66_Vig0201140 [Vigna angularis]|uniref:Uncharacterized protein n=1 Tax=Phaseolus angularis TaxID=3914 RepID=A0A8T0JRD3_PHAAN|nr:uncharacterized protein HKW66_Vig0201140 [Vigna angularis]